MYINYIISTIIFGLILIALFYIRQVWLFKIQQEKNLIDLAHKLQNPLTILKGQLDLAKTNIQLEKLDNTIMRTSKKINEILGSLKFFTI